MFWNFVLGVAARTRLHVPVEFEDSSRSNCFQESELWAFSCRPFGFWILGDPHKSPSACMITLSFIVVPRIDQMSHVVRKIFLRAPRAAQHQVDRFCLRWNRWSWLCHRWTFTGSRFLNSLWHGALLFRSDQKEKCWSVCKRTSRNSSCWTDGEGDPTRHAKNSSG